MKPLYFDYNATTPVASRVFEAMRPYLTDRFGNPGSGHMWGYKVKKGLETARENIAALIGASPEEIIFTGCATESNNMVMKGVFHDFTGHLVASAVEHPAVLMPGRELAAKGVAVSLAPVDGQGLTHPGEVASRITPQTRLVSVMLANNETGAIQPVAEIAALARERGVLVHTDAAQAVGKIPVNVRELGVDFLTIAGHKLYAPKGVGALYVRAGLTLPPLLAGGGQERGMRSGTENTAFMAGLGEACAMAAEDLEAEGARQRELGAFIESGLEKLDPDMFVPSKEAPRLPNTLCIGFGGYQASDLLSECAAMDLGLSAGAACHAGETSVSHVLTAMNVPKRYAEGTLRISWGRPTTLADAEALLNRLQTIFRNLPEPS